MCCTVNSPCHQRFIESVIEFLSIGRVALAIILAKATIRMAVSSKADLMSPQSSSPKLDKQTTTTLLYSLSALVVQREQPSDESLISR